MRAVCRSGDMRLAVAARRMIASMRTSVNVCTNHDIQVVGVLGASSDSSCEGARWAFEARRSTHDGTNAGRARGRWMTRGAPWGAGATGAVLSGERVGGELCSVLRDLCTGRHSDRAVEDGVRTEAGDGPTCIPTRLRA